jgi:CheY-like chemotaxis protein
MVVDDDEHIRDALSMILEDEGFEALCVDNGRAALDVLNGGQRPCVILLDLMMPVMDGWQFRQVQKSTPEHSDIPVVVITAAGASATSTIDANKVLHKPITADAIMSAVSEYCDAA